MLMVVLCESRQIAPKHLTSSKLTYAELLQLNWNPEKKPKQTGLSLSFLAEVRCRKWKNIHKYLFQHSNTKYSTSLNHFLQP